MRLKLLIAIITLASAHRAADAQAPQVNAVWPPGGMRGGKVSARVEGGNLTGVQSVLVSGKGVTVTQGTGGDGGHIPLTLDIAPDAGPGPYEVRVTTSKGVSNPAYLWVGAFTEKAEVEPNSQLEVAMKVDSTPVTLFGRMDQGEDVDWYTFPAQADETLVVDIAAFRLFSQMDPFLELRDPKGRLVASAMEGYDRDPRIIYKTKLAGDYRLQVRDVQYRGGAGFLYKVTVGKVPVITSLSPAAGRRGQTLQTQVEGVNLGGMATLSVSLPADIPEDRPFYVIPVTPAGPGVPVAVAANDAVQMVLAPVLAVQPSSPTPVYLTSSPITYTGRLGAPKVKQLFRLDGQAGKPVQIRVAARSIGSRLYPMLRILDGTGKELLNTEESIGQDPSVTFSPPANGAYTIELSAADGYGGPDYPYRVTFWPIGAQPEFRLAFMLDVVNLGKGQTVAVTVTADRRGGFDGPIQVSVKGLPAGVKAGPLVISPGQSSGTLTFTAAPDAGFVNGLLEITGESMVGGKPVVVRAEPQGNLPRPGEGTIVSRPVNFAMVATNDAVPLYNLSVEPAAVELKPGQTAMVKVTTVRKPGDNNANGAIALTLANLPPGVTAETPAIPEKQGEVTIKLTAAADAAAAVRTSLLTGKLGETVQPAPALNISVVK
jgi:hypothetical protein